MSLLSVELCESEKFLDMNHLSLFYQFIPSCLIANTFAFNAH